MTAVQIAHSSQDLSQLTGDGSLARARITCKDDMHPHLLLLTQSALLSLDAVLHRIGNLTHGTLHLIHADELIEILQDIIDSTLLRDIAPDIFFLHLHGIGPSADEMGEDILSRLIG